MTTISALWRRLDTPGHDACRLLKSAAGWQLEGTAVFRHEGVPARLSYRVACDRAWRTQRGEIHGWVGEQQVELTVVRTDHGVWTLNGALVPGFEALVDLDLSFTPATNLPQLRRSALAEGQTADIPVAWLDVPSWNLQVLPQRYERRTGATYWYEAPTVRYSALLEVAPSGFIRRYPDLWEME
jgi:hypothetical protein